MALANPRIFYLQLFQSVSMILSSFFVFRYLNTLHSQYANMQASPPQRNKQTPTIRHSLIIKAWTRHQPRLKTDTIPIPPHQKGESTTRYSPILSFSSTINPMPTASLPVFLSPQLTNLYIPQFPHTITSRFQACGVHPLSLWKSRKNHAVP